MHARVGVPGGQQTDRSWSHDVWWSEHTVGEDRLGPFFCPLLPHVPKMMLATGFAAPSEIDGRTGL